MSEYLKVARYSNDTATICAKMIFRVKMHQDEAGYVCAQLFQEEERRKEELEETFVT